jgi:hypothetical protein
MGLACCIFRQPGSILDSCHFGPTSTISTTDHCDSIMEARPSTYRYIALNKLRRERFGSSIYSLDERGNQVAQMQHIYGSASMVVVLLGEAFGGAEIAVNYIERVGSDPNLHIDPAFDLHASCQDLNITSPSLCTHLNCFFGLPWFTRIWTVQEFVVAREITFVCVQRPSTERFFRILWQT